MLGVRIDTNLARRLEKEAKKQGYTKSRIVKAALEEFLARRSADETHDRLTLKGWQQVENGEGLPADEIYADLDAWGTQEEI